MSTTITRFEKLAREIDHRCIWFDKAKGYAGSIDKFQSANIKLKKALGEIANWTMHTGRMAYEEADNAYYIIEAEVFKAKKVAREALKG